VKPPTGLLGAGMPLQRAARAECSARGLDPELFFPQLGEPIDKRVFSACWACQIRAECLRAALQMEAAAGPLYGRVRRYGVWGGLTASQRSRVAAGKRVRLLVPNADRNKDKRGAKARKAAKPSRRRKPAPTGSN
jgi:hypothetical protein